MQNLNLPVSVYRDTRFAPAKGSYTLTADDIVSCRDFDDTIACGGYPIDIHAPEGMTPQCMKKTKLSLEYGDIYHIPYRSLHF